MVKEWIADTINQYSVGDTFTIDDKLLWESLKLLIRGKTIAYSSFKKREQNRLESELWAELDKLQKAGNRQNDKIIEIEKWIKNNSRQENPWYDSTNKIKVESRGEKRTKHFCNLEKRHYKE